MNSGESVIINHQRNSLKYFKADEDGIYQLNQTIFSPNSIEDVTICPSEEYLAFSTRNNEQHLHKNNINVFSHLATYTCSSGYAHFITFSRDCSWLAYICTSKQVILYKNMDPFTFIQSLNFSSIPSNVKISDQTMLITYQNSAGVN